MQKSIEPTELGNTGYLEEHQVASNYRACFCDSKDWIQVLVQSRWQYLLDLDWTSCKSQLRSLKRFDRCRVVLLHIFIVVMEHGGITSKLDPFDWWQGFYTCLGEYEQFSIWSWGGVKPAFTYGWWHDIHTPIEEERSILE